MRGNTPLNNFLTLSNFPFTSGAAFPRCCLRLLICPDENPSNLSKGVFKLAYTYWLAIIGYL